MGECVLLKGESTPDSAPEEPRRDLFLVDANETYLDEISKYSTIKYTG